MYSPHDGPPPPPEPGYRGSRWGRRRRSSGPSLPLVAGLLVLAALAGAGWWWFVGRSDSPLRAIPGDTLASTDTTADPGGPPEPLDLPPLDESDGVVRDVVGALSRNPRWASWLATDELARRFVSAVTAVAAGGSPGEHVPFMEPEGDFQVRDAASRPVVDPASYRRYDAVTEVFVSLDTRAAVRLYQQLLPLFADARSELGFPEDDDFGVTLGRAIDNVLAVRVPPEPPALAREDSTTYLYADPGLEASTAAQKHVLRLGPDNARRVQSKLRELRDALVAAGAIPAGG